MGLTMTEQVADDAATVVPLRRPPVRQATLVRSDITHTFETFVSTIGTWWPLQPMSVGGEKARDARIEPRVGGSVVEVWDDGSTVEWGRVGAWEPPHRFVMSWILTPAPTEVEFTFTSLGPVLTRVTVEHRGWEALTEEQLCADCAAPGGYRSGAYRRGWELALGKFAAALGSEPPAS